MGRPLLCRRTTLVPNVAASKQGRPTGEVLTDQGLQIGPAIRRPRRRRIIVSGGQASVRLDSGDDVWGALACQRLVVQKVMDWRGNKTLKKCETVWVCGVVCFAKKWFLQ